MHIVAISHLFGLFSLLSGRDVAGVGHGLLQAYIVTGMGGKYAVVTARFFTLFAGAVAGKAFLIF